MAPAPALFGSICPPAAAWMLRIFQTASDQFNYPYDTYLNVPMSTFHESPSLNPDLAQSRDDFDFYPADPVVEDQHGRTSLYHPNVIDYDNSGLRIKGVDHPPVAHPSPLSTGAPTPSIRSLDPPETPYSTGSLISIAPAQGPFLFSKSPKRSAEDTGAEAGTKRPRRPIAQNPNFELNEEERLLLQLKDEDNLPWKDIAQRFQLKFGRPFNVPALQMRSKRLREKIRVWTETDVSAELELPTSLTFAKRRVCRSALSRTRIATGRATNGTSSPPRCSTLGAGSDGRSRPAATSGKSYIPGWTTSRGRSRRRTTPTEALRTSHPTTAPPMSSVLTRSDVAKFSSRSPHAYDL